MVLFVFSVLVLFDVFGSFGTGRGEHAIFLFVVVVGDVVVFVTVSFLKKHSACIISLSGTAEDGLERRCFHFCHQEVCTPRLEAIVSAS